MKKITFLILFLLQVNLFSFDPAQKFSEAMDAYNSSLYSEAYRLLEDFFSAYELKDELYATAKYYSADALFNLGDQDGAAAGFEYLVNNFQSSNFRDRAL